MKPHRKRKINPHDHLLPLSVWIPRAAQLAAVLDAHRERKSLIIHSINLPNGFSLTHRHCRERCAACPHTAVTFRGKKGRPLALAVAELSRKYSQVASLIAIQKKLDHIATLVQRQVRALSKDLPQMPRPEGLFTPIPFHLYAWKIIANNHEVISLQHEVRDWNVANNRSAKGLKTSQGALGFRIVTRASGTMKPLWSIWVRGDMGQWLAFQKATPTFGKGFKNPANFIKIPISLTARVCVRTGNSKHSGYYLQREIERASLVEKIESMSSVNNSLVQISIILSRGKVK